MKVFISWSGERSRLIAQALAEWLPRVIQAVRPWVSDDNIAKGELWSTQIGTSLSEHKIGIVCVTPENYQAPWLLFEAGALSKVIGDAKVCPLLLGMSVSELEGPLRVFQATVFEKHDVYKLVKSLNEELDRQLETDVLSDSFERFWPDLEKKVTKIASTKIPGTTPAVMSAVNILAKYGLPEPKVGAYASFSSGFESHGLYSTLISIAKTRLYIWGRKNRKFFDKEHKDFLTALPDKTSSGFDFRALFLNPEAPLSILEHAHQDDTFELQLKTNVAHVKSVMERQGLDVSHYCRKYSIEREYALMIADDAVAYTTIEYDENGRAKPLTKTNFSVINSTSILGMELIEEFISTWDAAEPL